MFVNHLDPTKANDASEPDNLPIGQRYARSAILYGPPGASKTTIVRALAGVIGWDYIELHASHFVADGLPNVQRKADEIFKKLMELDRAIVLFDEIDELVREREAGSDAFGRFLTTSMLPKLAELWEGRKIMYFVATNHINYFDRAITRAQRFDAVIFVGQPSFEAKIEQLKKILFKEFGKKAEFAVKECDVDDAMPNVKSSARPEKKKLKKKNNLAKFALLRWDELPEVALHLSTIIPADSTVDRNYLTKALDKFTDGRLGMLREYAEYQNAPFYQRRDYGKPNVWILVGYEEPTMRLGVHQIGSKHAYDTPQVNPAEIKFEGYAVTPIGEGTLRLEKINK